ncbi:MAG: hypothetical protein ACI3W8_03815 [Oscillospiraceae bacterium]
MKKLLQKIMRSDRLFSNAIIVYCVAYMSVYLQQCLRVLAKTSVNPSTCVTVAGGFFGGELLLVCLAYRFKQATQKKTTEWEDTV